MAQGNARDAGVIRINSDIETCIQHLHQRMSIQGSDNTRLIVTGHTYFECCATFTRQSDNISILQNTHAVTNPLRAQLFDRFFYIVRWAPLASVNGYMQTRLTSFLDQPIKWFRLEL